MGWATRSNFERDRLNLPRQATLIFVLPSYELTETWLTWGVMSMAWTMRSSRLFGRSILRLVMVVAVALLPVVLVGSPARAQSCSQESTKFVYDTSYGSYFGNRGAVETFDHHPICSGEAMAQSFFMRLSSNYDWVETGARQYPSDDSGHTHAWVEAGSIWAASS